MYDKITITKGDIDEVVEHLDMNGYCFERIGQNLYVYSEETDYVETILVDHQCEYEVNDGM